MLTVRAGDHDVECVAPLALVRGRVDGDGQTPQDTLDVHSAGWVGAAVASLYARVSLEVDVEGSAASGRVAMFLALDGVVRAERIAEDVLAQIVPYCESSPRHSLAKVAVL